ncbi:MAG: hypothetical protein ACRCUG_04180 [Yersinia sp. (in: enterobacteria)]
MLALKGSAPLRKFWRVSLHPPNEVHDMDFLLLFHYSTIPLFHYSTIPLFHYSTMICEMGCGGCRCHHGKIHKTGDSHSNCHIKLG